MGITEAAERSKREGYQAVLNMEQRGKTRNKRRKETEPHSPWGRTSGIKPIPKPGALGKRLIDELMNGRKGNLKRDGICSVRGTVQIGAAWSGQAGKPAKKMGQRQFRPGKEEWGQERKRMSRG